LKNNNKLGAAESNVRINDGASTSGLQSDGANTKKTTEEDFLSDEEKDETTPAKKRPRVASEKKKSSFQLIQDDIKESTAASVWRPDGEGLQRVHSAHAKYRPNVE